MTKFKILSIDPTTETVRVAFDLDNKTQTIAGAPLTDASALVDFLSDYARSYEAGLLAATPASPTLPGDVSALVNQVIAAREE